MGTFRTYTLKVQGSYITLKNITIENNAAKLGQAVSLHLEGDHILVQNCRLLGNQDTVYMKGGTLELQMGNQPSKWGTRPADRP